MSRAVEELNRRMLRARDAMDGTYAEPLDIARLARVAHVSEAHFIRTFKATFGETPHRYLQRRRVERAMFLLGQGGREVTDICLEVGFTSLGSFSRTFHDIVGESPTAVVREQLTKGQTGGHLFFTTDDCKKTYEELVAKGVEFTEAPTERPYGIDCGLRDPFGNHIRFSQMVDNYATKIETAGGIN